MRKTIIPWSLLRALPGILPGLCWLALGGPAHAQASLWVGDGNASARLIAAASADHAPAPALRAGIEIRLAPGWKTYWRYPGDAGIPPHFDFAASENVGQVSVLWPAPQLFHAGQDASIGYGKNVVFPLRVTPKQPDRPVVLRVQLDYAICEKLCVPAHAALELKIDGSDEPALAAALTNAEARVPQMLALNQPGSLSIVSVRHETGTPGRVLVDIRAPAGPAPELFVEGPDANWALPIPARIDGAPEGLQRFAFALEGIPRNAELRNAELTFTALAGTQAIETRYILD